MRQWRRFPESSLQCFMLLILSIQVKWKKGLSVAITKTGFFLLLRLYFCEIRFCYDKVGQNNIRDSIREALMISGIFYITDCHFYFTRRLVQRSVINTQSVFCAKPSTRVPQTSVLDATWTSSMSTIRNPTAWLMMTVVSLSSTSRRILERAMKQCSLSAKEVCFTI